MQLGLSFDITKMNMKEGKNEEVGRKCTHTYMYIIRNPLRANFLFFMDAYNINMHI